MALAYTDLTTLVDDCDVDDYTGDASIGLETDFEFEPTGAIGLDCDIETVLAKSGDFTAINMTDQTLIAMMNCFTALTLDTLANGGMGLGIEDSSGNQDIWYVGGVDTYQGGWKGFAFSTSVTPDVDGSADHTDITNVLVRWKCLAKSKLSQNCFHDFIRRINDGDPCFRITGTNATVGEGYQEIADLDATNTAGLFTKNASNNFETLVPFAVGDGAGTLSTDFTQATGAGLTFLDMPVNDVHYGIIIQGNGTGTTDIQIGDVVGSGDDRQGVQGGSITTAGPSWLWDSQTDIADLDNVLIYGINIKGAKRGIDLDDGNKTTMISFAAVGCGNIDPGTTNNGAELLTFAIIDPEDDVDSGNSGLLMPNTTHNIKKGSFITTGVPTTQHMVEFTQASDYTIALPDFVFFGNYTSSTLHHGENSGANADIIVSATGSSNMVEAEVDNTGAGPSTTDVQQNVQVTFDKLKDNSEIWVFETGTQGEGNEIAHTEAATAGSPDDRNFAWTAAAALDVYYSIHSWDPDLDDYIHYAVEGFIVPNADVVLDIPQQIDRNS